MSKVSASSFNLRDRFGDWWDGTTKLQRSIFRVLLIGLFYALPLLNNPIIDTPETSFTSVLFYPLIMFSLMAVGLNVVVGKSGILDLGYVAFFAIGAYTHALLSLHTAMNFWEIIPFAMGFAMLAGVILGLPALRLRGDYLAIITLGFGEIVRIVAINIEAIGGAAGITDIPGPTSIFGIEFTVMDPRPYYFHIASLAAPGRLFAKMKMLPNSWVWPHLNTSFGHSLLVEPSAVLQGRSTLHKFVPFNQNSLR